MIHLNDLQKHPMVLEVKNGAALGDNDGNRPEGSSGVQEMPDTQIDPSWNQNINTSLKDTQQHDCHSS